MRCAVGEAAGAADLAALDFDIVARPVAGRHAELLQAQRCGLADAPGHFGKVGQPERRPIEHQFPADLPLVEIEAAAAGDPAHGLDAVRPAVIELDLLTEILMDADQCRGAKAQEADGVGNPVFAARVDQRLIEGDVRAPAAQAGGDHAERLARRFAHVVLSACCFLRSGRPVRSGRPCRHRSAAALCGCRCGSA